MKIKIYFHVPAIVGWEDFVDQKTNLMKRVGLWAAADSIKFLLHYPGSDFTWIYQKFSNDPKVLFWECQDSVRPLSEIYSQRHIWECCQNEKDPVAIFRYHTKGLTYRYDERLWELSQQWTNYLDYWNIELWKTAYLILKHTDYESVGANWHPIWKTHLDIPGHWSGNIWWANSEYIKKLPLLRKSHEINNDKQLGGFEARHDSELWIGVARPKILELHHFEAANVLTDGVLPPDPKIYRLPE